MPTSRSEKLKLSVFLITSFRLDLLKKCVSSVLRYLPSRSEVVVIVNGEDEATEEWLESISDSRLRRFHVSTGDRSSIRNLAWQYCHGEVIHFIDDDVEVPPEIFQRLLACFQKNSRLALLGGPNLTPPSSGAFERYCGELLASPVVCPLVYRRYRSGKETRYTGIEESLIGCNFAIRRKLIPDELRFIPQLVSNEENVFHHLCVKAGLQVSTNSSVFVYHYRRNTLLKFFAQMFSYGTGRGQQWFQFPESNRFVFLLPMMALLALPLVAWQQLPILIVAYSLVMTAGLTAQSRWIRRRPRYVLYSLVVIPGMHLSYAMGTTRATYKGILCQFQTALRRMRERNFWARGLRWVRVPTQ